MTALLLTIPLIAAAPVPKDFKKEAPKLDGAWVYASTEINGQRIADARKDIWTFDGDNLTIQSNGAAAAGPIPIKTDVKASPMAFEFVGDGDRLGVYEIKDGSLVISKSLAPGVRPTNLDGGNGVVRWTFKRVEPK